MQAQEYFIGLMSGTSLDAVDACLVDLSDGIRLVHASNLAIPDTLRRQSRDLNLPADNDLQRSLILDRQWGYLLAEAAIKVIKESGVDKASIRAIGSHGQTVRHEPGGKHAYSLQIGDPNTLCEQTGITVVADFRRRDIAAGGQGAPLAPAFHQAVFASQDEYRAIINIGGMANITQLGNAIAGFDSGPGNVLMDSWIQHQLQMDYDRNGDWAASGKVLQTLLKTLLDDPYFAKPPPKSTGREYFGLHWLTPFLDGSEKPEDIQATLAELTAHSICQALQPDTDAVYVCGGGAFNHHLLKRMATISKLPVKTTAELGIPPQWLEAIAFAWLAKQTLQQCPGNIPAVTGALGGRILGAIYQA